MIVVSGAIQIAEPDIPAAKSAALTMMAKTAREPGCITYRFATDIEHADIFHIYEEWQSLEHLQAHFKVAHMQDFQEALKKLKILSRDVKMFEAGTPTRL